MVVFEEEQSGLEGREWLCLWESEAVCMRGERMVVSVEERSGLEGREWLCLWESEAV